MARFHALIKAPDGLHARPTSELVRLVSASGHYVQIGRLEGPKHAATSMLGILSLGIRTGEHVEVDVTGPNEDEVAREVAAILCNLGE